MNYLKEQTDGEAMINFIQNGDHSLPVLTQVSLAGTTSNVPPPPKDKSMWIAQEKKNQKIDRLSRSLLIQGLSNDIYSLIDSNNSVKELWDALERHMLGSEYGEQDRKATVLYEYETFKATEGEMLLDTYIQYLQQWAIRRKQWWLLQVDTVLTSMVEQAKLKLDLVGKLVGHTDYRSMIGSLMYLTSSRPDIMFATCLLYPKDSGFDLTAYSDADHARCHLDQKIESEYVAISGCRAQVLWMRTQLTDYVFFYDEEFSKHDLVMYELQDNQSLLLQYSRDGYVIEEELKEYEDSRIKSSVQVFYKAMLN
nr:hypothetical protein [Tanacetum cinerariifolium]